MTSFRSELDTFRREAEAAQFLYGWQAVDALAQDHAGVLKHLNTAPLFWNAVQNPLQLSTIIALGRIFDNGSAYTVATLLKSAQDVGIFSKEELGRRKRELSADAAEWLDDYLARAHETSTEDVRRLKKEVGRWRNVYEQKYKPIRDRYYAHKELPHDSEELHKLFAGTRLQELKQMCMFLLALYDALWNAYENGSEPVLSPRQHLVRPMLSRDHKGQSAPEIVVKQVQKFFAGDM
jgi:hypothetical protein